MKYIRLITSILFVILIAGCAHSIAISPDITKIEPNTNSQRIEKNVGYFISSENRELAVTTPGSGGDKATYYPYREIETAFYKMLSNVFRDVTLLKTPNDVESIKRHAINYVFIPVVTTNSSSSIALTWPPTQFTLNLTCDIVDSAGSSVTSKSVTGEGLAEYSEFKSDFSLSAKRAVQDALLKMQRALLAASELNAAPKSQ